MAKELTQTDFISETKSGYSVIDFWAPWCGPCQRMGPEFDSASKEMAGKAKFAKVNVDDNQELAGQFNIMGIPTMIIFNNGKEVHRVSGTMSKAQIVQLVESKIKKA